MNSDDIDYLKGFTVMEKKDAIAEAWDILKEEENKSCSACEQKDMIIRELQSHIQKLIAPLTLEINSEETAGTTPANFDPWLMDKPGQTEGGQ